MAQKLSKSTLNKLEGLDSLFDEEQVSCACCRFKCPECDVGDIVQPSSMSKIEADIQKCIETSTEDVIDEGFVDQLYDEYYDDIMEAESEADEEERDEWPQY